MSAGGLTLREAAAIHDDACEWNGVKSSWNARRQLAIERLMAGKAAFLCLDDYSNQWACAAAVFAMEGDPHGTGKVENLCAHVIRWLSQSRDPNPQLEKKLSRLHPLNPAAERDMAVALTYVASLKQKAPTP